MRYCPSSLGENIRKFSTQRVWARSHAPNFKSQAHFFASSLRLPQPHAILRQSLARTGYKGFTSSTLSPYQSDIFHFKAQSYPLAQSRPCHQCRPTNCKTLSSFTSRNSRSYYSVGYWTYPFLSFDRVIFSRLVRFPPNRSPSIFLVVTHQIKRSLVSALWLS